MPEPLPPVVEDWSPDTLVLRCEYHNDPCPLFVTMGFEWYQGLVIEIDEVTDADGNVLECSLPLFLYRALCRQLHTDFNLVAKTRSWLHENPDHMPEPSSYDADDAVKDWKMDRSETEEP